MRPPGNTQRSGMKLWPPWRLPIRTRGFLASRRMIITVAAFFGRTARAPGTRGGPSGLRNWLSASLIKQLYDRPGMGGKGAFAEGDGAGIMRPGPGSIGNAGAWRQKHHGARDHRRAAAQ